MNKMDNVKIETIIDTALLLNVTDKTKIAQLLMKQLNILEKDALNAIQSNHEKIEHYKMEREKALREAEIQYHREQHEREIKCEKIEGFIEGFLDTCPAECATNDYVARLVKDMFDLSLNEALEWVESVKEYYLK